jgi:outer membrane protein
MQYFRVAIVAVVTTIVVCIGYNKFFTPKLAYVNTGKLIVGFSEAAKVEKELKAEDEKWRGQLKILQDSLQAAINLMSKEYDKASVGRKKELQDFLSAQNQQVNNFQQANMAKIEEMRQKKMGSIFEKANVYMAEFGKKHHFSIIFGTASGGSILYGNENDYDITNDIIKGLNERYK